MERLDIVAELTQAAERARLAGDVEASLVLAFNAAEYLHLVRILAEPEIGG